jgi:hypothetical protein
MSKRKYSAIERVSNFLERRPTPLRLRHFLHQQSALLDQRLNCHLVLGSLRFHASLLIFQECHSFLECFLPLGQLPSGFQVLLHRLDLFLQDPVLFLQFIVLLGYDLVLVRLEPRYVNVQKNIRRVLRTMMRNLFADEDVQSSRHLFMPKPSTSGGSSLGLSMNESIGVLLKGSPRTLHRTSG